MSLEEVQLIQPATMILQKRIHEKYCRWIASQLSSATVKTIEANPHLQVLFLRTFGNELFRTGEPMYLFRHLVVFLQQTFPNEKPKMATAWELLSRLQSRSVGVGTNGLQLQLCVSSEL